MDWLKKHVDTVFILGGIVSSILWMNGKFNDVDAKFLAVERDMYSIKTEIMVMKTVMVMNGNYPKELNMGDK